MSDFACLCSRCGGSAHGPEQCPMVAAIEYHENGTIKRIEYVADVPPQGWGRTVTRLSDGKTIFIPRPKNK